MDEHDDKICVAACALCLREASKHIELIDPAMSQALLELAAATTERFGCKDELVNEMESIKNELEHS